MTYTYACPCGEVLQADGSEPAHIATWSEQHDGHTEADRQVQP